MSENNNDETFGYGIDIGYDFKADGSIDFSISDSGDISLVGGSSTDTMAKKRKNALQQIMLRIITPFSSMVDHKGETVPFGSEFPNMVGVKDTNLNKTVMKAYVLSCLQDYRAIEAILNIDVTFPFRGVINIKLTIKLKDDDEILFETISIGGS